MAITTLSNQDVMNMLAAGVAADTVITTIYSVPKVTFDVSVAGIIVLGTAKVPDAVIHAMIVKFAQSGG